MREAHLGIAVGKRGIGKTYTTLKIISDYVNGFKGTLKPRRVLIMDVNDEFSDIPALKLSDVPLFSMHPKIEIRRIRPFHDNGTRMTINDVQETLFKILFDFRNGTNRNSNASAKNLPCPRCGVRPSNWIWINQIAHSSSRYRTR